MVPARALDEISQAARPTATAATASQMTNGNRTNPAPPPSERPIPISHATIGGWSVYPNAGCKLQLQ